MAKVHQPVFVQHPRAETAIVTGASTDRADPAASVLLWEAGAEGSHITAVWALPRGTVTATEVQLYLSTDEGVTQVYIDSALLPAHTVANTTANPAAEFERITLDTPLTLPAGTQLYVGAAVALATGIVVTALGGDF